MAPVPPIKAYCDNNDSLPIYVTVTDARLQFHQKCGLGKHKLAWKNLKSAVVTCDPVAPLQHERFTGFSKPNNYFFVDADLEAGTVQLNPIRDVTDMGIGHYPGQVVETFALNE